MRQTHFTVLVVCEGHAEDEFARVIRDLYLERNCGTVLSRFNARGNSNRALEIAIDMQSHTEHDRYGLLIDTDAHWGTAQRELAERAGIVVLENTPCLEATLLKVDNRTPRELTRDNKVLFEQTYGGPAHRIGVVQRHFPREKFDEARARIAVINQFLQLIRQ